MNIYLSKTSARSEFLFANSICNEIDIQSSINKFNQIDIYDVALTKQTDVIILNYKELKNIHVSKFLKSIETKNINCKTKLILIDCPIDHNNKNTDNIIYIQKNTYLPYNEYFDSSKYTTKKYILIDLESIYTEINESIRNIVYPVNKTDQIIMVNCPESNYLQNVGIAHEQEMLELIAESDLFISLTSNYIYDAINMNKKIIVNANNDLLPVTDSISTEDIQNTKQVDSSILKKLRQYKISHIIKNKLK